MWLASTPYCQTSRLLHLQLFVPQALEKNTSQPYIHIQNSFPKMTQINYNTNTMYKFSKSRRTLILKVITFFIIIKISPHSFKFRNKNISQYITGS